MTAPDRDPVVAALDTCWLALSESRGFGRDLTVTEDVVVTQWPTIREALVASTSDSEADVMRADLYRIVRALGIPALPYSGHEAVGRDVLPLIAALQNATPDAPSPQPAESEAARVALSPHDMAALRILSTKEGEWFDSDYWFIRRLLPKFLAALATPVASDVPYTDPCPKCDGRGFTREYIDGERESDKCGWCRGGGGDSARAQAIVREKAEAMSYVLNEGGNGEGWTITEALADLDAALADYRRALEAK